MNTMVAVLTLLADVAARGGVEKINSRWGRLPRV